MIVLMYLSLAIAAGILMLALLIVGFDRYIAPQLRGFQSLHRVATYLNLLVRHYRGSLAVLGLCFIISVLVHALMLTSLLILARALFGAALSISQSGLSGVMATIASQIPITPGGLAVGEGTFAEPLPSDKSGLSH